MATLVRHGRPQTSAWGTPGSVMRRREQAECRQVLRMLGHNLRPRIEHEDAMVVELVAVQQVLRHGRAE